MKKSTILILVLLTTISCTTNLNTKKVTPNKPVVFPKNTAHLQAVTEGVQSMYAVFVSDSLGETKKFYTQWFGYSVVFESTWFLLLQVPGSSQVMIAFMNEEHPSSPPEPKRFAGDGAFLTIDVSDADKLYNAFKEAGADFAYHIKDEPWGQKRFAVHDPNGIWLDVVQQTKPDEGWWDQYLRVNE